MNANNPTQLTDFRLNSLKIFHNLVDKILQNVHHLHCSVSLEQTEVPTCSACVSIMASSSSFTHSASTGELTGFGIGVCTGFKVRGVPDLRGGTNVFFKQGETVEVRGDS